MVMQDGTAIAQAPELEEVLGTERRRRSRKAQSELAVDDVHELDFNIRPKAGEFVRYQVRRGRTIPMLVTEVYADDLVDGVAFSAWATDGTVNGTMPVKNARRGDGDGQWQTSP